MNDLPIQVFCLDLIVNCFTKLYRMNLMYWQVWQTNTFSNQISHNQDKKNVISSKCASSGLTGSE